MSDRRPVGWLVGYAPRGMIRSNRRGERGKMGDWISGAEAARIMGVHRNTVLASLRDARRRGEWWGAEGECWRFKPLSARGIYEVDRARARDIAAGRWPPRPEGSG